MPLLNARHLTKNFHQGDATLEILKDVNLTLEAGETLAIVGQSGSGKTTLLSLLTGLDRPTSGTIHFKNQDITTFSETQMSRFRALHMGIIFQQFHLMANLTALENVALPLELAGNPKAYDAAENALKRLGLMHRLQHFPRQLSGGECQRTAIARAFVVQPDLLFADEPSGNLDAHTAASVTDLLFELVHEHRTTLVLVTHNETLARRCATQKSLVNGRFS